MRSHSRTFNTPCPRLGAVLRRNQPVRPIMRPPLAWVVDVDDSGEERQPGRASAERLTWRTATRFRRGPPQKAEHRREAINRLKQSRAVATRYDKRGYVFLGTTTAASPAIRLST
ncbi:hypothetical protein GCM10010446_68570 [Streptomyces enissocaesilis]|uniref:Transposase n=1 Tax=Streptomyces enissocaesilis TaxID=332589 RepID=A0ABN3XP44_9ACTN